MSEQWPIIESTVEYETRWYAAGYDEVKQPDGSHNTYYWVEMPPAVIIVATTDKGIVLVKQYRPVIEKRLFEVPTGVVEDGESYVDAGTRELTEETGYRADSAELLQTYYPSPALLRQEWGVVHATDLVPGNAHRDENEFLEVRTVPTEDILAVARGDTANGATLVGLFVASQEGRL